MFICKYDLSLIDGTNISDIILNDISPNVINKLKLNHKFWMKNDKKYNILKYDKRYLSHDLINSVGLIRSIIYSQDIINVFSPPKSLNIELFAHQYKENECWAEEFIEGTMVNLFYDSTISKWEIATKTTVGGNVSFFKDQLTFSTLFGDICKDLDINFDTFSKDNCYSFVMQHPKNKFVIPIVDKKLYLIAIYNINNDNHIITELPLKEFKNVSLPKRISFDSYDELKNMYGSMNVDAHIMGVVIRHKNGDRTKMRNPNYEYLKQLRGNNPKLQYQYLSLRKLGSVKTYLKYFPENRKSFTVYRKQVHDYTNNLYENYIKCFIKKEKPLSEYSHQFKIHMYNLHQYYLSIREYKGFINKNIVINYINNLQSAQLMYILNYHMREITKMDTTNELSDSKKNCAQMQLD